MHAAKARVAMHMQAMHNIVPLAGSKHCQFAGLEDKQGSACETQADFSMSASSSKSTTGTWRHLSMPEVQKSGRGEDRCLICHTSP
jgi:hypothetical protein